MDPHSELLALCDSSGLFAHVTDLIQPVVTAETLPLCVVWTSRLDFGADLSGTRKGIYNADHILELVIVPSPTATDRQLQTLRDNLLRHIKQSDGGRNWTLDTSERLYELIGRDQVKVEKVTVRFEADTYPNYSEP